MTTHAMAASEMVDLDQRRVHRMAYTDPRVFEAEMDRIFRTTWVYVAHECELQAPGDYKTTTIGTEPVIVARADDGQLQVLSNRCRHRGASVCQARTGNARFFRCEYHGWTYRNNGQLVGVTYGEGYGEELDKNALGLARVPRVESYRGFVFASFNEQAPPLVDHLAGAREYLDLFIDQADGSDFEAVHGAQEINYAGNWKFQLENGCDGYHPNFTHRSFFAMMAGHGDKNSGKYMGSKAPALARGLGNGHGVLDQRASSGTHYADRVKLSPGAGPLIAALEEKYTPEELTRHLSNASSVGFNLTVFPNLQLIGTHIREIIPQAADSTTVRYTLLTIKEHPAELNRLRMRAHELFYTAAGFGVPDDGEMFLRLEAGLGSQVDWLLLSRGTGREHVTGQVTDGHITDEVPQRSAWTRWLTLMSADEVLTA
jgi:phenylpropionate dioxygenase-like ring-hydroxylating dioxygenase large terminal subunit